MITFCAHHYSTFQALQPKIKHHLIEPLAGSPGILGISGQDAGGARSINEVIEQLKTPGPSAPKGLRAFVPASATPGAIVKSVGLAGYIVPSNDAGTEQAPTSAPIVMRTGITGIERAQATL